MCYKDVCDECGRPIAIETLDGVIISVCPDCAGDIEYSIERNAVIVGCLLDHGMVGGYKVPLEAIA